MLTKKDIIEERKVINSKKEELEQRLKFEDADLDAIEQELNEILERSKELDAQEEEIQRRERIASELNRKERAGMTVEKIDDAREERGRLLKENRAVLVSSGDIILPKYSASDIRPTFNEVSSLLDLVQIKMVMGGESFEQPYMIGYGTGDYTAEAADYATAEPMFGYAAITKAKITAYAEESEELIKLPAANYEMEVVNGVRIALRKKITRHILTGPGTTNTLAGIFSSAASAIDPSSDIEIASIDVNTLDTIIYAYGGEEDVESTPLLIMNKHTLGELAKVRNSMGVKEYDITYNGNTGTINGIPFVLNSAVPAFSAANAGDYVMAYGYPSNYLLTIFSDVDVMRSTDYKFRSGMVAYKGSVFVGGNVVSKNGFLRVKKATVV